MVEKVILSWSGGKDSAFALYKLNHDPRYNVVGLLSIAFKHKNDKEYIAMHMIDIDIIKQQAIKIGLELFIIEYSDPASYEKSMHLFLDYCLLNGIKSIAFGDIHLMDLRQKRESKLKLFGMNALFPLWGANGKELLNQFFDAGFRAKIVNVDTQSISRELLGKDLNYQILSQYFIDVCGEFGEYHTLVYAGPIFSTDINYALNDILSIDTQNRYLAIISESI